MTKRQIEGLVETWKGHLGLDGWKIAVEFATVPDTSYAEINGERSYDAAKLTISPAYGEWTENFAEQTIVHELLHLLVRDIDNVVEDARSQLHPQASAQIEKRYDHEVEGFVDRLAIRIVALRGAA